MKTLKEYSHYIVIIAALIYCVVMFVITLPTASAKSPEETESLVKTVEYSGMEDEAITYSFAEKSLAYFVGVPAVDNIIDSLIVDYDSFKLLDKFDLDSDEVYVVSADEDVYLIMYTGAAEALAFSQEMSIGDYYGIEEPRMVFESQAKLYRLGACTE